MGKRATPTKAELTRALSAAKEAGMSVTRCEIGPNGTIILSTVAAAESADDAYYAWKASHK